MSEKQTYINFDEYIRQGEPSKREAAYAWSTAIGLQAVDGLKTSEYLNDLARRNIEGEITIDEVDQLLKSYYEHKTVREADDDGKEEADKASKNIKEWSVQPNLANPTSTPASTPASYGRDLVHTDNANIKRVVVALGLEQMSIKEMLQAVGLKDRMNFIEYSLTPSIHDGYVRLLYPDKPNHPRQKYLLTVKGLALYNALVPQQTS